MILQEDAIPGHATSESNAEFSGDSGHNSTARELPEFLKKKLRARGILKDGPTMDHTFPANVSWISLPHAHIFLLFSCEDLYSEV